MTASPQVSRLVVAVDGPAGAGKSSAARGAAQRLGLRYLDTGAMYRAITWWLLQHDVDPADADAVAASVDRPFLELGTDAAAPAVQLDGTDVRSQIRSREVSEAVSAVSAVPAVRARLVGQQRALIGPGGIVVEGRDIGTVVAPTAAVKVFLTASASARARRRSGELLDGSTVQATEADLARRDDLDSQRPISPLVAAADAVRIDTTDLSLAEVVDRIVDLATAAAERPAGRR
jgi:cytidylate kinase